MLTPTVRRTLAPRGQTPVQHAWDRYDRISAISAITISPIRRRLGLYFDLLPTDTNATGEDVVDFVDKLIHHIGRRFTVVWDGHRIHDRAKAVRAHLARHPGIRSERFPPYAPELNPDEQVWTHTKYARLANFAPTDIDHLRRKLHHEFRRLQRRPDLLASFIRHTRLPIQIRAG